MKTLRFKFKPALFLTLSLAIPMLLGVHGAGAAVIVNVVETGGENQSGDTVTAKWTGQTWSDHAANEPILNLPAGTPYTVGVFTNYSPTFVDRAHRYTNAVPAGLPPYLAGAEYIMSGNDNRGFAAYRLDVTVSAPVAVYMLIDNRLGDPNSSNADPPSFGPTKMQWILDEGWLATTNGINRTSNPALPDEVAVDEGADGTINQWYSVYVKTFPAGTFQLKQADNAGQNMYGVVIVALPPMTPVARLISPTNNAATFQAASNNLVLGVLSATPMDTNSIQVTLNGSNITSSVIVSGDDTNVTVTYSGLTSNTIYSGTITVTNNVGPTTFNFSFDTFVPGSMLVIETEDYNYGDGDCSVPGNPLPPTQGGFYYDNPAPGTYNGLMGYPEIDYHDTSTNVNSSVTNAYRLCDPVGTRISGDVVHPPFDVSALPDYELWQMQSGEWQNYTRTIAAGTYAVYLRVASTGPATIRLDKVSGDVTLTTNQPTSA